MPYRGPVFYKDGYYHVYSRGVEKRIIFLEQRDYIRFLKRLREYKEEHQVDILAYCLMPNHYHFLLRQNSDVPLSIFLQKLNISYSMYFNTKYERVGPLFQGRFKSKLIDTDEYLLQLSKYIHLNPREIPTPKSSLSNYPWSSYSVYLNRKKNDSIVRPEFILSYFSEKDPYKAYRNFVEEKEEDFSGISDLILE